MFEKCIKTRLFVLLVIQFFLLSNFSWSSPSKEEIIDNGNNLAIGNLTPGKQVDAAEFRQLAERISFEKGEDFAPGKIFVRKICLKDRNSEALTLRAFLDSKIMDKSVGVEKSRREKIMELSSGYYVVSINFQDDNSAEISVKKQDGQDELVKISLSKNGNFINLRAEGIARYEVFYFKNIIEIYLGDIFGYFENTIPVSNSSFRYPREADLEVKEMSISLEELATDERKGREVIEQWKHNPELKRDEQGRPIAPLGFLFLNGGQGTRMKMPMPKGHVNIVEKLYGNNDISLIAMHLRMVKGLEKKHGIRFHVYIINSNATDSSNIEMLQREGLLDEYVHLYSAGLTKRRSLNDAEIEQEFKGHPEKIAAYHDFLRSLGIINPGDPFPENLFGEESYGSPGHMEAMVCGILTGAVEDMIRNGIKFVNQVNVQHVITHDFLDQMLGEIVREQERNPALTTVLHFRLAESRSKPGGVLYVDRNTGKIIMLEDSVLDKELKYKQLRERTVAVIKRGKAGVSTANYIYDVPNILKNLGLWNYYESLERREIDYVALRRDLAAKVSTLPVINPTKIKSLKMRDVPPSVLEAFRSETDRDSISVFYKQPERQIQDMVTTMPSHFFATPDYRACSIKDGPKDIQHVVRNVLLTNLPYLKRDKGFSAGEIDMVKSKVVARLGEDKAKMLEAYLEDLYNYLLRVFIASQAHSKQTLVLKLTKEELAQIVGITSDNRLYFKEMHPLLLVLPLMKNIIEQVEGFSFDFFIQIKESDQNDSLAKIFMEKYEELLKTYGISGQFGFIRNLSQTPGMTVINFENLNEFTVDTISSIYEIFIGEERISLYKGEAGVDIFRPITEIYDSLRQLPQDKEMLERNLPLLRTTLDAASLQNIVSQPSAIFAVDTRDEIERAVDEKA